MTAVRSALSATVGLLVNTFWPTTQVDLAAI